MKAALRSKLKGPHLTIRFKNCLNLVFLENASFPFFSTFYKTVATVEFRCREIFIYSQPDLFSLNLNSLSFLDKVIFFEWTSVCDENCNPHFGSKDKVLAFDTLSG